MNQNVKKESLSRQQQLQQFEHLIMNINSRIESLKTQFNLYFAGEMRVPPEGEREAIEKIVRDLQYSGPKNPRATLLILNLSSSFSVYNNMWKKRLNELESGMAVILKKKTAFMENSPKPKKKAGEAPAAEQVDYLDVSLNSEDSFERFFDKYAVVMNKKDVPEDQKEKVINSLKTKLISENLIDAKVGVSVSNGKLKLKIKV